MTYELIEAMVILVKANLITLPASGKNEDGETIVVQEGEVDGNHFYRIETYQNNGWIRVNNYYEDGTIDESFEK